MAGVIAEAPRLRTARGQRRFATLAARTVCELEAHALAPATPSFAALREGLARSPYWREVLRERGLSPRDLQITNDLQHFPMLDRATLGARWQDVPALGDWCQTWRDAGGAERRCRRVTQFDTRLPDLASADVVAVRSSGTTGAPVKVVRDRWECLYMWAVLRFWVARLGLSLPARPTVALLCALPGGLEYTARLPLLDGGVLRRIAIVRRAALARLRRAAPAVLFSDPAGLHWLAGAGPIPAPRLVLTSAQHFGAAQRAALSDVTPAPVVNYWSTTETGPIAWECLDVPGRFHVLAPDVWVESALGELVVTRLRPSVLPLLRYRTGDRGGVDHLHCVCGVRGQVVTGLAGRRECRFVRPDGETMDAWALAALFKSTSLDAFTCTQTGPSAFDVTVAGAPDEALSALRARLVSALAMLGWPAPVVAVRTVNAVQSDAKPEPFRRRE